MLDFIRRYMCQFNRERMTPFWNPFFICCWNRSILSILKSLSIPYYCTTWRLFLRTFFTIFPLKACIHTEWVMNANIFGKRLDSNYLSLFFGTFGGGIKMIDGKFFSCNIIMTYLLEVHTIFHINLIPPWIISITSWQFNFDLERNSKQVIIYRIEKLELYMSIMLAFSVWFMRSVIYLNYIVPKLFCFCFENVRLIIRNYSKLLNTSELNILMGLLLPDFA